MSNHPIEDCQYYIWEEARFASYEEFKSFYDSKDIEDTLFKNFCIQEWADYAMKYTKKDKLNYASWVVKNKEELWNKYGRP